VPIDSLIHTVAAHQPALIGLSLTFPQPLGQTTQLIAAINDTQPDARMMIGGQGVPEWLIDDRVTHITGIETVVDQAHQILATRAAAIDRCSRSPGPYAHLT
jgi:hypothetical protein